MVVGIVREEAVDVCKLTCHGLTEMVVNGGPHQSVSGLIVLYNRTRLAIQPTK